MRKNHKLFFAVVLALLISTFFIFSQQKSQPKYLFKIASDAPDGSSWINGIREINQQLNKKTNGEVGIVVYPGAVMGDQSTVIKKIKIGQLNGSTFSSGGLGLIYKDFAVMGFPMVFQTNEEYDYVVEKMGSFFEKKFEENDYVLLAWSEVGLIYIFSKKKVNSIATLQGSKPLLFEGDDISSAFFKEINATPVPIQLADVLTGLQTGLIDTVYSSPYTLIITQWYTKVKYMANTPITFMIGAIMVDKKIFYSMPLDYQKEMKSMFASTFVKLTQKLRQDNKNALASLTKNGQIVILDVEQKEKDVFLKSCNNVIIKLTEKEYSRELLNRIKAHVSEYRKSK